MVKIMIGRFKFAVLLGLVLSTAVAAAGAKRSVPIVYCTDLFHPAMDPDDHFDLAALFAMKEFDVKGVVLDGHIDRKGQSQFNGGGRIPLSQMMKIAGYSVPSAVGLDKKLSDPLDTADGYDPRYLAGVELMAKVLRESPVPVTFKISTGTDLVVLFNRYPDLCRQKIGAVYFNAGHGVGGKTDEYNVSLDPVAFRRVFELGLPLYWNPCFGEGRKVGNGRCNFFPVADQRVLLERASPRLSRFFSYALVKPNADPIAWLDDGSAAEVPKKTRWMWTPPVLAHAAGLRVYRCGTDDFVWMRSDEAAKKGLQEYSVYTYEPVRVSVPRAGVAEGIIEVADDPQASNVRVFKQTTSDYARVMTMCLRNLYAALGESRAKEASQK